MGSESEEERSCDDDRTTTTGARATATTNEPSTISRKARVASMFQLSRPKGFDRYIHKLQGKEHADEFYDMKASTDPELKLAERLTSIENNVAEHDDVIVVPKKSKNNVTTVCV